VKALLLASFDPASRRLLETEMEVVAAGWALGGEVITPQPTEEEILPLAADASVIIVPGELSARVIAGAPHLRVIGCCRGDPRGVDLAVATARGIPVVYAAGRNAASVADLTVAFILMLARRLPEADAFVRGRRWGSWADLFATALINGLELAGLVLGLVGCGAVGRAVACRALAFGMRVLAYDPYVSPERLAKDGIEKVSLSDLLQRSDFVSVHCKESPETVGLIGAAELAQMKRTAYLINTARAAIVDQAALYAALTEGRIAGAALDVHWQEPIPADSPFLDLPRVILTPHIGGATTAVEPRTARLVAEGVMAVLRGERPENVANPEAWERTAVHSEG
jgi:D-3-phosphoglycerate dehydrogenase